MLDGYAFSEVNADVPKITKESVLYVKVRGSGFGDYGLSFVGFPDRGDSSIGCYMSCRAKVHPAVEIYRDIEHSLDELRTELGGEVEHWKNKKGWPRIGFTRPTQFPLPTEESTSREFADTVQWMRERLEGLVSTLHPRLERRRPMRPGLCLRGAEPLESALIELPVGGLSLFGLEGA